MRPRLRTSRYSDSHSLSTIGRDHPVDAEGSHLDTVFCTRAGWNYSGLDPSISSTTGKRIDHRPRPPRRGSQLAPVKPGRVPPCSIEVTHAQRCGCGALRRPPRGRSNHPAMGAAARRAALPPPSTRRWRRAPRRRRLAATTQCNSRLASAVACARPHCRRRETRPARGTGGARRSAHYG